MKTQYEFPTYLQCPKCQRRFNESEVELLNIEEDFSGTDIVTFICPKCHKVEESHRYT